MRELLIDALHGKNQGRAPVWLMRQAGRYLPEYRKLKEKYTLRELFFIPELAAQVTKMPIDLFGVDAAILFSDITVTALALGLKLDFPTGPRVSPLVTPANLHQLTSAPEELAPIIEAIHLIKKEIQVPLLGFCGAPFTVASYLIGSLEKTISWMRSDPKTFRILLDHILCVTCVYLQMQEHAGVDAIQIFDSWANVLTKEEHQIFSLTPLKKLVQSISIPSLFFMREGGAYLEQIPCGVSLDWTVDLKQARAKTKNTLQGNLNPDDLFLPLDQIQQKTESILNEMEGDPAFILNLGHGVKKETPVEAVRMFIETAKNHASKSSKTIGCPAFP